MLAQDIKLLIAHVLVLKFLNLELTNSGVQVRWEGGFEGLRAKMNE